MQEPSDITQLLDHAGRGDREAWQRLVVLVYPELKRLAHRSLSAQPYATLNTTGLVHECYLKLAQAQGAPRDRGHLMALTARIMRQILVDHARERLAEKRGAGQHPVTLTESIAEQPDQFDTLIEIDRAVQHLAASEPRQAQVFVCRYFAGYNDEDTALALDISPRTVHRDWDAARAFMADYLNRAAG